MRHLHTLKTGLNYFILSDDKEIVSDYVRNLLRCFWL